MSLFTCGVRRSLASYCCHLSARTACRIHTGVPTCQTVKILSSDDEIEAQGYSKSFVNRNPRNLEFMGIARKRKGWKFQAPRKDFYHQLIFERTVGQTIAKLVHTSGDVVVTASTTEKAINKHLRSNRSVSAAHNIGRVMAHRCLQAGLDRMVFADQAPSPAVEAFRAAILERGIELDEPEGDSRGPEEFGTDYDKRAEIKRKDNERLHKEGYGSEWSRAQFDPTLPANDE